MSARGGAHEVDEGGVLAVFYWRPKEDKAETERHGRPVFKDVPYVKIQVPSDPLAVNDRKVTEADKERWPNAWAAFEKGDDRAVNGTPIEEFPMLTAARVAELRAQDILSVEMLAAVKDDNLRFLGMDGFQVRERARQWLQGEDATVRELRAQLAEKEGEIDVLKVRVAELEEDLEDAKPRKKPGPKPKARNGATAHADTS